MPNTLTPEQLALFRRYAPALLTGGSPASMNYTDPTTGTTFAPAYSNGGIDGQGNPTDSVLTGYYGGARDPAGENSKNAYTGYDLDGNATSQFMGNDFSSEFDKQDMMGVIAVLASLYGGAALAGAGAGGAGAGAAAAGATETMPYLSLLEAPSSASYIAGLEPYAIGGAGAVGGAAGGAAGASLGGAPAYTTAAADSQLASATLGLGPVGGATAPAVAAGLTGAGSVPSWLGGAASLVGGMLGSQPQTRETTSQNQIDPRMVPYIYGDQGLLSGVQQQLARSTSPEARARWDAISAQGMGMLSQPVAGNGFSRLTGR